MKVAKDNELIGMYRYAGYRAALARSDVQVWEREGIRTPETVLAEVELGRWEARRTRVLAQLKTRGQGIPKPKSQEVRKPRKKYRTVKARARAVPPVKTSFSANTFSAGPVRPTIEVDLREPSAEHVRAAQEQLHHNQKFYPKGGRFRSKNSLWSTYDESAMIDPNSIYVAPSDPTE